MPETDIVWAFDETRWRGTVERVGAAGYHAVAFDMPGHGFAAKGAEGPTTVPELARYMLALLAELGISRVTLVGTSLGAHVAAYAATTIRERVRGLMMVGALGLVPIGRETGEAIRRNVVAVDRERIEGKLRFVMADPSLVTPELVEEEFRINNSPGAIDAFRRLGDYIATEVDRDCVGVRLAELFTPGDTEVGESGEKRALVASQIEICAWASPATKATIEFENGHDFCWNGSNSISPTVNNLSDDPTIIS